MKFRLIAVFCIVLLGLAETASIWGNTPAVLLFWVFPLMAIIFLLFPSLIQSGTSIKVPTIPPPKTESANPTSTSSLPGSGIRIPGKPNLPVARPGGGATSATSVDQLVNSPPLQALFEKMATLLSEDFSPVNIQAKLLEHCCNIIEASEAQIYFIDTEKPDFLKLVATFPATATQKRNRFSWTETSLAEVVKDGNQFFAKTASNAPLQSMPPIPALACTPVIRGKKVLGILVIEKFATPFAQSKVNPLLVFLMGQFIGNFMGLFQQISGGENSISELKKEVNRLLEHQKKLENTAQYLDGEVDRQFFENADLEKQRKFLVSTFQKFVSPIIIERIVQDPGALKLGGVKQKVTIFFSDIRNFTRMSEKLDPSQIVSLLNEYFSVMTSIILKYEGTLDKYVGDEIMALFGAPLPIPDQTLRAVICSLEMHQQFLQLKTSWEAKGFTVFDFGTGLNTGEVTVGFIGSEQAMSYTAIGDVVNLGSRLCDQAKPQQILISEATAIDLGDSVFLKALPEILVKGKEKPVKIFEVLGLAKLPGFATTDQLISILSEPPADAIQGYRP